jgi:hypothetical protein
VGSYTPDELLTASAEELDRYERPIEEAEQERQRQARIEALLDRARAVLAPVPTSGHRPGVTEAGDSEPDSEHTGYGLVGPY